MGLYLFVSAVYGHMAAPTGFEPIPTESKSVVLPIILQGHILGANSFAPEAGLEPAIALVLGKCLNHLNYSGKNYCCSRLMHW